MSNNKVGAGILNIITESLYDNPIVVFREYVQNSLDSIIKSKKSLSEGIIKIWRKNNNLFFFDNGNGIDCDLFKNEMEKIGASSKKRQSNLGYKGIGRLSGVPYCTKLYFYNIFDYANNLAQRYTIDNDIYNRIKSKDVENISFEELMEIIGSCEDIKLNEHETFCAEIKKYDDILQESNVGFVVVLESISSVLINTIERENFVQELQWLLPLDFYEELYNTPQKELFDELTKKKKNGSAPALNCAIYYNDKQIFRPITQQMLRKYVCKLDLGYATIFHTFNGDRFMIERDNAFSGIRMYIDNMLLCDETELLQSLDHYGLLEHTSNGQLQSVRGIGAMIYITDKLNISANARRTFIEVTDEDSLQFLKLIAEFVNTIYDTRYALSRYSSAIRKQEVDVEKIKQLKINAAECLKKMATDRIELTLEMEEDYFSNMSDIEKKKTIKKDVTKKLAEMVKEYLKQLENLDIKNAYSNFCEWLKKEI